MSEPLVSRPQGQDPQGSAQRLLFSNCTPCRLLVRCCDRLVQVWLRSDGVQLPDPMPAQAQEQVRRLRLPLIVAIWALCGALGLQMWCLVKGWYLVSRSCPHDCENLHRWLLGYCIALSMVPFCFAIAGPLVVWWAADGSLVRSSLPNSCQEAIPMLYDFVDEVASFSLSTCLLMAIVFLFLWLLRRRTVALRQLFGHDGPTLAAVVQCMMEAPAASVEPGMECSICLEAGQEGSRWRSLPCSHTFHEDCLLQWLQRGRRCPLCRLDLHMAYLNAGRLPQGDEALTVASNAENGTATAAT